MTPRIGSMFSGYGGLDLGVQAALGGTVAWHAETEPAATRILTHHWPGTPNHGDVTTIDWATVEPVDILTGGTPCQDLSHAGQRAGMRAGTRSGLWVSMRTAINVLRPSLVVWENVRGALSAPADSAVEPCPGCVGDGSTVALRALGRVLGDLAGIGYDARWCGVRASDSGAPHQRFRVFVTAWPADAAGPGLEGSRASRPSAAQPWAAGGGTTAADAKGNPWGIKHRDSRAAADTDSLGREWSRHSRDGRAGSADGGRHATAADTESVGWREGRPEPAGIVGRPHVAERCGAAAADTDSGRQQCVGGEHRGGRDPHRCCREDGPRAAPESETSWGVYTAAVRRWERTLGRPAPPPTEPGPKGAQRLSPRFTEWMMGLPAGHVTGVPDVSRTQQLKALGNGVVPQQAALALRLLLGLPITPPPADPVAHLLPTPAVNDMGRPHTPATWDEWTERMKARHQRRERERRCDTREEATSDDRSADIPSRMRVCDSLPPSPSPPRRL